MEIWGRNRCFWHLECYCLSVRLTDSLASFNRTFRFSFGFPGKTDGFWILCTVSLLCEKLQHQMHKLNNAQVDDKGLDGLQCICVIGPVVECVNWRFF